jgi:hypothetical protein
VPTDGLLSEFLTPDELSAELNLKPTTIKAWRRLRKGPPSTTIGARVYYRRATVIVWLASCEDKPEPKRTERRTVRRRAR